MGDTNNLVKYREAKRIQKDLSILIPKIRKMLEFLNEYNGYMPVRECVNCLNDNLMLLEIKKMHYQNVIKTKGKE